MISKIRVVTITGLGFLAILSQSQLSQYFQFKADNPTEFTTISNSDSSAKKTSALPPEIIFFNGKLSLHVNNKLVQDVAKIISQRARLDIVFDVGASNPQISIDFDELPLETALLRFLNNFDIFIFHPSTKAANADLATVWVFSAGHGKQLKPLASAAEESPATSLLAYDEAQLHSEKPKHKSARYKSELYANGQDDIAQNNVKDTNSLLNAAQANNNPVKRLQALIDINGISDDNYGDVLFALETAMQDKAAHIRRFALQALANRLGDDATEFLKQALQDPDLSVQIAAVENAKAQGKGLEVLEAASNNPNELIRLMAADRLKNIPEAGGEK